ncbi:MAG TPA: GreA/GreB family elongation factor [Candidatus Saccharimonadales bacterium]|nr:GreA/GreB family elongation factor [Candidatus Saccharimonadales bacterium]
MNAQKKIIFTKSGYEELQKKYTSLLTERVSAVEQLKKAREMGDLSENGFYKAAKQKLGSLDHDLFITKHYLRFGVVTESNSQNSIQIGSRVTVDNGQKEWEITLVGKHESNPSQNKISFISPLGKGLLNKHIGETINIETPKGTVVYRVIQIK